QPRDRKQKEAKDQRHQAKTRAGRGDVVRSQTNDFDHEDDTLPKREKARSAPQIREAKKGSQERQSKENKVFSKAKSKQKQRGHQRGRKGRTKTKAAKQQPQQPAAVQQPKKKELPEKITYSESLTVAELAKKLNREPSEIIKKLLMLGVMATINQDLDKDAI